jgi:hypothetical protein
MELTNIGSRTIVPQEHKKVNSLQFNIIIWEMHFTSWIGVKRDSIHRLSPQHILDPPWLQNIFYRIRLHENIRFDPDSLLFSEYRYNSM